MPIIPDIYDADGKIDFGKIAELHRLEQQTFERNALMPPIRTQGAPEPLPVVNPNPPPAPIPSPKGFFGLPEWVTPVAAGAVFLAIYMKIAKRRR